MSLPLLKLLGHEISLSSWSSNSKRIVWTACCLAFYGSFRMGELLPVQEWSYSPNDNLLWGDVRILTDSHALIHIKKPKSNNTDGEYVDLFPALVPGTCPVSALNGLKDSLSNFRRDQPVFCFDSGKNLTPREFNLTIQKLLVPHVGDVSSQITGHSFRAAVPAVLARFPELSSSDEIMGWGRWKSHAYLSYTRLKMDQRRKIFSKVLTALSS